MTSILDRLQQMFPSASRTTMRQMLSDRRVLVNGLVAVSLKEPLIERDVIRVLPRRGPSRPASLPFPVVYDDADLIVINKPHGMLTSSGPRDRRPTVIGQLRAHFARVDPRAKIGLVHRLDADAAGLLVLSKNPSAHAALKAQFFHHDVERVYLALVDGEVRPAAGRIDSLLVEPADGRVRPTRDRRRGERAITHYETIEVRGSGAGAQTLLRVRLETGRKHQIRVHLSEKRWPIVNDPLYNPRSPRGDLRLVAISLSLRHPGSSKSMKWELPAPRW